MNGVSDERSVQRWSPRSRGHGVMAVLLLAFLCGFTARTVALDQEAEADRYVLAGQKYIEQNNYVLAADYLERVLALRVTPPLQFYHLYGDALFHNGEYAKAKVNLERYVDTGGRDAQFYTASLQLLTAIEERQQQASLSAGAKPHLTAENQDTAKPAEAAATGMASATDPQQYLDELKHLYMQDDVRKALVTHINSLLKSYVFVDSPIKDEKRGDVVEYSLSLPGDGELVVTQQTRHHVGGQARSQIAVERINAYGLYPFLHYQCDAQRYSCWLTRPSASAESSAEKWIVITNNETAVTELVKAFQYLIKDLQR
jgi:tetratricopeptide (TPR) repeat protein